MGVYRGGFRRYDGPLFPPRGRFLVVTVNELGRFRRSRWVKALGLLALVPLVVLTAVILGKGALEAAAGPLPINLELLRSFLGSEQQIMALLAATAGAGLIAEDRRANAILLYLARPLSPAGYVAGKALALAVLLGLTYLVPALAFLAVELMLSPTAGLLDTLTTGVKALAACGFHIGVVTAIVLLFSALGRRARYVGLAWVALFFLSKLIARGVAQGDADWARYLSLPDLLQNSGRLILEGDSSCAWDFVVLAGLGGAAAVGLAARTRRLRDTAVAG